MTSELSPQTFLIVGGSGSLGQHITQDLISHGVPPSCIHILDLISSRSQPTGLTYHHADITSASDLYTVFQLVQPKMEFHNASPYPYETNRTILERVNINGTSRLIKSAQESGSVVAFVYKSSSTMVHDHYHHLCGADESYPVLYHPEQPNYYSYTKAVAEDIVLATNHKGGGGMLTVALRLASMYGESDPIQIPNMVKTARAGCTKFQMGQ